MYSPGNVDMSARKPYGVASPAALAANHLLPMTAGDLAKTASAGPSAYLFNNSLLGLQSLHAAGLQGQGVVVAVLDSGLRPGFPHISGSVIGGEDFVNDGLGYSNAANDGHGTFVSGMIAAHAGFCFSDTSVLVRALNAYAPGTAGPCIVGPPPGTVIPGFSAVPMIGSAPGASLYHLRVLGPTSGAPTSRIIAAMERAIELRRMYDANQAGGVNIQVANMSLGGSTLNPGRELIDEVVRWMYDAGIVVVVAAGNTGPATLTAGSPAASADDLTVGAASTGPHERILWDIVYGSGIGGLFRAANSTQVANFSSRGPNADGRREPDVVANGMGNFGQGYAATPTTVNFGSGTSFATPSVAGVAAVLRQAYPGATARQIRNAIRMAANAGAIPGATDLDRGAGFVNAGAAAALLAAGAVPNTGGTLPNASSQVKVNVETRGGLNVVDGFVSTRMSNLIPGERRDLVYRVGPSVRQVVVALSGFSAALPASQQNQLFGDDIHLAVHSAKTSAIGRDGDYSITPSSGTRRW
jgi:subtilisin family serine protease